MSRCKQNKIKLWYNRLQFFKETQDNTVKTQNGESNYADHKFFLIFTGSYLPVQNLGERNPNTIELASFLVYVLCYFKTTWHQEAYFSICWIHHGSTFCWCPYFTLLVKVLPPSLHYSLGSYLYLFLLYILQSQN